MGEITGRQNRTETSIGSVRDVTVTSLTSNKVGLDVVINGAGGIVEFNSKDIGIDTATNYAANDQYGDLTELASGSANTGSWSIGDYLELDSIQVFDADGKGPTIQVEFFHSTITVAADNAAYSISDADYAKRVASARIAFSDHMSGGNGTAAMVTGFAQKFKTVGTSIFMNCKVLEATSGNYSASAVSITAIFKKV